MFIMHDKIKQELTTAIYEAIGVSYSHDVADKVGKKHIYDALTPPPNLKMGHLAFGCFPLAKMAKKSPVEISAHLAEKIPACDYIEKAVQAGPYLNLFLNIKNIAAHLLPMINSEQFFELKLTENTVKSMVEFSQPNTHKEMHVGHMRNLCLGDSLIKILRYCGYPTVSTTFPGDVGTHVAKCLWYYQKHNKETPPEARKGAWLGTLYTKGNNLLTEQLGTGHEEENRAELTAILKQLEQKSGSYYDLWQETRAWSIDLMQEVYKWAKVDFDVWYWESDVDSDSVKLIKEYQDKGLFKEDDGAVGIDLSDDKLGFCILLKSDGTGLYATKDIELARRKFQDHQIEKNIYVVDNRQSHHFKQVFKVLEKMGFEQAKDCFHLQYEMVELPDGAMSSRKGNIVPIQALIDQMVDKIQTEYLSRYKDEWEQQEIDLIANQVAAGAIKYGMTCIDNNKKIVFDMDEWLKLDGESGPYIQYVHARINSMLIKLGKATSSELDYGELTHQQEQNLILKLMDFNNVVESACAQYKTSHLCSYLYELSKLFNSFYAECSVAQAGSEDLKQARLALCESVATTLKHGLGLLGIEAPDKM
jgi:arginyl-tRNA synthetase